MSTTIDSKVVEMKFDNAQFERNVSTSMGTIEKLKSKLDFSGMTKGLEHIGVAAGRFDMSPIGEAIQQVHAKFSALEIATITVFQNITNAALNAGKKIATALIDPMKTGFSEYETQIGAIQTILANTSSKGTTLQEVNAALATLNAYSDKTIYNFTEMAKNIGTFTAAGVDLGTSVDAIKGIANLAAASGSNAQQATTAMYQLSQALSTGTVKLMDWNSVTNAGMGGELFKNSLIETARVHGIAIDDMIKNLGSFRETLQEGWLTSEILTETLSKFTGDLTDAQLKSMGYSDEQIVKIQEMAVIANDAATKVKTFSQLIDTLKEAMQSGWTKSWELLVGDFGEAKELLTEISNIAGKIIGDSATARNNVLLGGLSTGWKQFLNEGIADEEGLKESLQSVAEEMQLQAAVQTYGEEFSDTLKRGWVSAEILQKGVAKLTSKMSSMSDAELEAAGYTKEQVSQMVDLNWQIATGAINLDEFAKNMARPSGRENLIEALKNSFEQLLRIIAPIKEAFLEVFPAMTGEQLYELTVKIKEFTAGLTLSADKATAIKKIFKGVFSVFNIGVQIISAVFNGIKSLVSGFTELFGGVAGVTAGWSDWVVALSETLKETDFFNTVIQKLVSWILAAAAAIKDTAIKAYNAIKDFITLIGQKIGFTGFTSFNDFLTKVNDRMNQLGLDATNLKDKISTAIGILGEDIKNSEFVKFLGKIGDFVKKVGSELGPAVKEFGEEIKATFSGMTYDKFEKTAKLGIGAAIAAVLGDIGVQIAGIFKESGKFMKSLVDILDAVRGCLEAYQDSLKADVLTKIAVAVAILAASILVLTFIDPVKLGLATGAIGTMIAGLMASMSAFSKSSSGIKDTFAMATALMAISVAVLLLAASIKIISDIDTGALWSAWGVITLLLAEMIATVIVLSKSKSQMQTGMTQLIAVAVAIRILAESIKTLGKMDTNELIQGGLAVGSLLAILAVFIKYTKTQKDMVSNAVSVSLSILIISGAMLVFAEAAKRFGDMKQGAIYQGIGAMVALIVITGLFIKFTEKSNNAVKVGLTMMAIAKGMGYMADAISKLGTMNFQQMLQGIAGIGLVLLGVFMFIDGLKGVDGKQLLAVSASLLIISGAMYVIALAVEKIAAIPFDALKNAMLSFALLIAGIALVLYGLSTVGPMAVVGAAAILIASVALIAMAAALTIVSKIPVDDLKKSIIAVGAMLAIIIAAGALALVVSPGLAILALSLAALGVAMLGLGLGISYLATGLNLLATIGTTGAAAITAVAKSLFALIPLFAQAIVTGILTFCTSLIDGVPVIVQTLTVIIVSILEALKTIIPKIGEVVIVFLDTLADIIQSKFPRYMEIVQTFLLAVLELIKNIIPPLCEVLGTLLVSVFKMLEDSIPKMVESVLNIITALLESISSHIQEIVEAAISIVVALIEGLAEKVPDLIQAAFDLIIAFIEGMATAIDNNHDRIFDAVEHLIDSMVSAFGEFVDRFVPVGGNIISGVIQGLKDAAGKATDTIKKIGGDLLSGFKDKLGIESPSKEFAKLGKYSVLGVVKGLNDYASLAVGASKDLGTDTVTAMSDSMSTISSLVDGDVDMTPVIAPVLDLTNVSSGMTAMDAMFGSKSINMSASVDSAASTNAEIAANKALSENSEMATSIDDMKNMLKSALDGIKDAVPKIEFNGEYSFKDQADIKYFMNQAALLVDRGT